MISLLNSSRATNFNVPLSIAVTVLGGVASNPEVLEFGEPAVTVMETDSPETRHPSGLTSKSSGEPLAQSLTDMSNVPVR